MENAKYVTAISEAINKKARKAVFYIGLSVVAATVALIFFLLNIEYPEIRNATLSILLVFLGPVILIFLFVVYAELKIKGKATLANYMIIFKWFENVVHESSHIFKVFFRTTLSLILYSCIVSIGLAIISRTENLFLPARSMGIIISYYSLVLLYCYCVIALPRLIAYKTEEHRYRYFYWLQFYKSILSGSPVFSYLGVGLFIIASMALSAICYVMFEDYQHFTFSLLGNKENAGLVVSTLGIWVTVLIALGNDFLLNYSRLDKCYENHTTYTLRKHILDGEKFTYLLVGLGNLGKITAGFIIPKILKEQNLEIKKPMTYFEAIIDREYKLRIFPRKVVAIELDQAIFEETRMDPNSGLTYGFTSGKDLISEMANKQRLPESIALFTLNGDGGNLPMLKLADYNSSKLIINTSSDTDMGLRLKMITERELLTNTDSSTQSRKLPTIITTVEDSSIYSFLESENQATIFPLHAGSIEGNSIATRLFHMTMNLVNNSKKIEELRLIIVGNGKTIYYALSTFHKLLKMTFNQDQIKALYENQLLVVSDDVKLRFELLENKQKSNTVSNLHFWDLQLDTKDSYKTPLIYLNPASYYSMRQAFHFFRDNEAVDRETIVIMTTRNPHDAIRICQHLRQAVSDFNIKRIGVLASVSIEIEQEISTNLSDFTAFNNFTNKFKGFPSTINELILRKNLIIGNQIISISDCLHKYSHIKNNDQDLIESGEIACCGENNTGAYLQLLFKLTNMQLSDKAAIAKQKQPCFYNNYTYTLRIPENNDYPYFLFRGDAFLHEHNPISNHNLHIKGFTLNGSDNFKHIIRSTIPDFSIQFPPNCLDCGYNTRCPVSNGDIRQNNNQNTIYKDTKTNASIKIVGDYDDIPGSFTIAFTDFLMLGTFLKTTDSKLDLVYSNSTICDYPNSFVSRFYMQLRETTYSNTKRHQEMLRLRPILAVKIKPTHFDNPDWNNYALELQSYLNSFSNQKFELSTINDCILIKKEIRNVKLNDYIINQL